MLSGGLDSVTCLAVAKHEGFEVHALTFDYGQRHKVELDCARRSAEKIGVERFHLISFDLRMWGASALTSDKLEVPDYNPHSHSVPITYVPARNLIFLSFATALAEGLNARAVPSSLKHSANVRGSARKRRTKDGNTISVPRSSICARAGSYSWDFPSAWIIP